MKKYLLTMVIIFATLWFTLTGFMKSVKANEYTEAILGHIIQSKVNGNSVDTQKLLESELQRIGHQFAIQMTGVLQQYLPIIMDQAMTELKLGLDKQHKCLLLKDSKIKDKGCE